MRLSAAFLPIVLLPSLVISHPLSAPAQTFDALSLSHYSSLPQTISIAATRLITALTSFPRLPALSPPPLPTQTLTATHIRVSLPLSIPHILSFSLSRPTELTIRLTPTRPTLRNPFAAAHTLHISLLARAAPGATLSLVAPSAARPHGATLLVSRASTDARVQLLRCKGDAACARRVALAHCAGVAPPPSCAAVSCLAAMATRCAHAEVRREGWTDGHGDAPVAAGRGVWSIVVGLVARLVCVIGATALAYVVTTEAVVEVGRGVKEAGRRLSQRVGSLVIG